MAFYSTQEFLAADARRNRAIVRGREPPLPPGVVHPPEHERQRMQSMLDSIPETQPGPNAFATRPEMTEKKKIERIAPRGEKVSFPLPALPQPREDTASTANPGSVRSQLPTNPVYQAALAEATANPPTDIHPALRNRGVSDPPAPPRDSNCTTLSPFINAGMTESPQLKLNATPNPSSFPTFRGRVEERNEQVEYDRSGSQEERVPVFHPTPKMQASNDFAHRPGTPADALQKDDIASKVPVKTPKRSLLSKFKLSANSRNANTSHVGNMPADPADQVEEKVPPKAQAVLGETPKKHKKRMSLGSPGQVQRSPSKRNYFFSRKENPEPSRPFTALPQIQRPPNAPSTVISNEPQTAISNHTHFSHQDSRGASRTHSQETSHQDIVQQTPTVTRSQSVNLRYLDGRIPPTPPAKNTPPHETAAKDAKEVKEIREVMRMPVSQPRPLLEDDRGIVSNNDRISPTRFGSYGYRDAPTLVTQPSMMSLHASVVPDMNEATTMEEMEARVGGLDIEGISSPTDRIIRRHNIQPALYSPSMYSPEVATMSRFANPSMTPMLGADESRLSNAPSTHTKDSSSNGTIQIVYPDLANDPNYKKRVAEENNNKTGGSPVNRGRTHLSPELTSHGRTHSRDHIDNDGPGLFARHVDDREHRSEMLQNSPSTFSHASAMPSPLQYLPATTYTPPRKKGKGKEKALQNDANMSQITPSQIRGSRFTRGSGLGIENDGAAPVSTTNRDSGVWQIEPTRPAKAKTIRTGPIQPATDTSNEQTATQQPIYELSASPKADQRMTVAASVLGVTTAKLNSVLDMLNQRNYDMTELRNEFRETNARMLERLSAIESQNSASPTPASSPTDYSENEVDAWAQSQAKRVSTEVAHNFYRSGVKSEVQGEARVVEGAGSAGSTETGVRGQDVDVAGAKFDTGTVSGVGSRVAAGTIGARVKERRAAGTGDGLQESEGETGSGVDPSEQSKTIKELQEANTRLIEVICGFSNKIEKLEARMKKDSD